MGRKGGGVLNVDGFMVCEANEDEAVVAVRVEAGTRRVEYILRSGGTTVSANYNSTYMFIFG